MIEKLNAIFEEMQVEYLRQGSLKSVDEYPKKEFFTFWNWQDDNAAFFDNTPHKRIAAFTICYYTQNPQQLYSRMSVILCFFPRSRLSVLFCLF